MSHFRYRYNHAFGKIRDHIPETLKKGAFLDIGCGIGNGVAAAIAHGAAVAVGIDRSFAEFTDLFNIDDYPAICRQIHVDHAKSVLIECDIFQTSFPSWQFDYCLMLDSIEHVPDPQSFVVWAAKHIRRGGYLLIDACPLYYSPVGHHLWNYFPPETEPWAHLKPNFERRCRSLGVDEWYMQRFFELNRVTHSQIRDIVLANGFSIVNEHRGHESAEFVKLFEEFGKDIDDTIDRNLLFEDWILLVCEKL